MVRNIRSGNSGALERSRNVSQCIKRLKFARRIRSAEWNIYGEFRHYPASPSFISSSLVIPPASISYSKAEKSRSAFASDLSIQSLIPDTTCKMFLYMSNVFIYARLARAYLLQPRDQKRPRLVGLRIPMMIFGDRQRWRLGMVWPQMCKCRTLRTSANLSRWFDAWASTPLRLAWGEILMIGRSCTSASSAGAIDRGYCAVHAETNGLKSMVEAPK